MMCTLNYKVMMTKQSRNQLLSIPGHPKSPEKYQKWMANLNYFSLIELESPVFMEKK